MFCFTEHPERLNMVSRPPRLAYMAEWRRKNKDKVRANAQKQNAKKPDRKRQRKVDAGGKCEICGYDKCLAALHFHHPGGNPSREIPAGILMYAKAHKGRPVEEVLKGWILVCANCHAEIHDREGWVRRAVSK